MKRIGTVAAAFVVLTGVAVAAEDKPAGPLKVHMISGSGEYKSGPSLKALKAHLEKNYNAACTLTLARDGAKELPNIEPLAEADVLVVFCRRLKLPKDQLEPIQSWCKAGKAVVGIRTASHAFQTWLAFDKVVLGGDYKGHGGGEKAVRVTIEAKGRDHPILAGINEWTRPGKLYRNPNLAEDVTVLLRGKGEKDSQPLAWARVYDKKKDGRSFYTSMGLPGDFENEQFRRLLVNAIFWTAKRKVQPKAAEEKAETKAGN